MELRWRVLVPGRCVQGQEEREICAGFRRYSAAEIGPAAITDVVSQH